MLSPLQETDQASSPVTGAILLVVITIILATLVLVICGGFQLPAPEPSVPVIFKITAVTYIPDTSGTGVRGFVTLTNTRTENYRNRYLSVITYVNGKNANCNIPTLNNGLFCTLNHYGVWHIYGAGTWGNIDFPTSVWPGHSDISIEYKKGIMRPGDSITLEVIDTTTNRIISRDTFPHMNAKDARWFYNHFLNPQAA